MDAFLNNTENMHHRTVAAEAWKVKAEFAVKQGDLNTAITSLEKSYAARKSILTAVRAASLLYSAGLDQDAAHFVELANQRSEEHTSELQSLMRISYAVFCLKKKNNHI